MMIIWIKDEWTSDLMAKFDWEVKFKSIQEEHKLGICVSFWISLCSPWWLVAASVVESSKEDYFPPIIWFCVKITWYRIIYKLSSWILFTVGLLGRIQISQWFDLGIFKDKWIFNILFLFLFLMQCISEDILY